MKLHSKKRFKQNLLCNFRFKKLITFFSAFLVFKSFFSVHKLVHDIHYQLLNNKIHSIFVQNYYH